MPRSPIVLALLLCAAMPATARAQGLYEPFPEPSPAAHAQGYLERLGVTASAEQLQHGRFLAARGVASVAPVTAGGASGRAGGGSGEGIALVACLCGAMLAAGLLTLRTRL